MTITAAITVAAILVGASQVCTWALVRAARERREDEDNTRSKRGKKADSD